MPKALITGVTGQDGSYLVEFLLSKGYEVHGIIRRASTFNTGRLDHIYVDPHAAGARMFLHYGDLSDGGQLTNLIYNVQPDEIYHLGAQSHVRVSFDIPEYTGDITGLGTTRILESLRRAGGKARYYQASSSEMFGATPPPQGEKTPFYPRSPYGAAKVYSYWMAINYREAYNMFASNGILFNHESPRRGETFVTRKITRAIAKIKAGKQKELFLGNLDARRDWGFAYEYVQAMWRILQHDRGDDFVIGTGQSNSVKEFLEEAFAYAGLDWKEYVKIDPKYFRPTEVENLFADASKAKKLLGWEPKVTFRELVRIMVDADLEDAGLPTPGEGRKILAAKGLPVGFETLIEGTDERVRGKEDPGHRRVGVPRGPRHLAVARSRRAAGGHHGPAVGAVRPSPPGGVRGGRRGAGPRHPPGGQRGRDRLEPVAPRLPLLRQRRDGDPPDGGVPQGGREKIRPDRHRLRLPVPAAAHPVPRGRPLGGISRADQRPVRHGQEGDDGDGAGVPGGVRLQRDLPAPREPVRPPRPFLRAGEVPRHPRADPEVRRRPRIRRARGRGVGERLSTRAPPSPASSFMWTTPPRRSHRPPSGTTSRNR